MPLMLLCFCLLFQDEITSEALDTNTRGDRFQQAVKVYNSVQRDQSRRLFETLVAELEDKGDRSEDEQLILVESLKFLGVLSYPDGTRAYFERLIRFEPTYEASPNDLPPKIVAEFDRLKKSLVATLTVKVVDSTDFAALADVTLTVDGREVGTFSGEGTFDVLSGTRLIALRKANYTEFQETRDINPGEQTSLEAALARTKARLVFTTVPPDVSIFVNDQPAGKTDQPLRFDYRNAIRSMGLSEDQAASTSIDNMEPGTYTLRFEKPCFKTAVFTIPIEELKEILVKPIRLEPSEAQLSVSTPKEATGIVFLDQTRIGILPVEQHVVCPGDYTLRVKFSDGEFVKRIRIEDGAHAQLTAEPLPSIAWFGLQSREEGDPPEDPSKLMNGLTAWNVISVDPHNTNKVPVNPFAILFGERTMSEMDRASLTRHLRMDLYVAARVVRKKVVIRHLEVAFWTPLSDQIHVVSFDFRAFDRFREMLTKMDRVPDLVRPWLGLQIGRREGLPGCEVLAVNPQSPFHSSIRAGQVIEKLNGVPLRRPDELATAAEGELVRVQVGDRVVEGAPVPTLAEVAFDPINACPQAALAMFEKLAKYNPDPLIRLSARFNQARFQFFLGDYKEAFDIFSTMTLDFPYGINQGTLYYYQGLCFQKLKLPTEAVAAFNQVLNYPHATLFHADGPKAAFWAETELKNPNF